MAAATELGISERPKYETFSFDTAGVALSTLHALREVKSGLQW